MGKKRKKAIFQLLPRNQDFGRYFLNIVLKNLLKPTTDYNLALYGNQRLTFASKSPQNTQEGHEGHHSTELSFCTASLIVSLFRKTKLPLLAD